ncbi:MAG: hypothetical protein NPIRA04_33730 [Nitrospirales bacterium]|nr:MAG: hypothetical protein NPIRA04_33730 [Nitrospirales bacterium]
MVELSPLRRLEWLKKQHKFDFSNQVDEIIKAYVDFLNVTDQPEKKLIEKFSDDKQSQTALKEASEFGKQVFELLVAMSNDNQLYRILVV